MMKTIGKNVRIVEEKKENYEEETISIGKQGSLVRGLDKKR